MFSFFKLTMKSINRCVTALMSTFFRSFDSTEVPKVVFAVSAAQMPRLVCVFHIFLLQLCMDKLYIFMRFFRSCIIRSRNQFIILYESKKLDEVRSGKIESPF